MGSQLAQLVGQTLPACHYVGLQSRTKDRQYRLPCRSWSYPWYGKWVVRGGRWQSVRYRPVVSLETLVPKKEEDKKEMTKEKSWMRSIGQCGEWRKQEKMRKARMRPLWLYIHCNNNNVAFTYFLLQRFSGVGTMTPLFISDFWYPTRPVLFCI